MTAVDPARAVNLAALLSAQSERTFPLTVHQFMRLADEWWSQRFKVRMGKRASKLHKEILGKPPKMVRVNTDWRNKVGVFPRGILEQAFGQVMQEILDEAGEVGLNAERVEPFMKEPPTVGVIVERYEQALARHMVSRRTRTACPIGAGGWPLGAGRRPSGGLRECLRRGSRCPASCARWRLLARRQDWRGRLGRPLADLPHPRRAALLVTLRTSLGGQIGLDPLDGPHSHAM